MNIIDITHFYNRKSGGVKTYLEEKVRFFSEKDYKHSLIVPSEEDKEEIRYSSKYYFIKSPEVPFFKPYRLIINKNKVLEILQKEKPQIVEVGSPYFIPLWVNKNKEFLNYKTVGFFHSNIEGSITSIIKRFNKPFTAAAKSFIKKEYKDFDLIISPSKFIERYLNNLDMKNTVTVHLGIDTDIFSYKKKDYLIRKKYNLPEDKIILVYAGRLSSDKNVLNLAEVYNILSYFRPEKYHLLLIGSGHLEEKLLKKLKGSFTHLGYINNKNEYSKLLFSCDIFITPSKIETFGLAIVEAQACGLPVVAYKEAAIPEVVYKKELLAESIDDFIKNIEIASNFYLSENKRKEISFNTINEFNWDKTFTNLEKVYEDLLV